MKKGLKITAWILGLLAVLLLAGLVAIQSPAVQTALGKRVMAVIKEKTDANIQFKDISIRPFEAILLQDLVLLDDNPCYPDADTVLFVKSLSVKFSLRGLVNGKGVHVSRLRLSGGGFNMVNEPDPQRPGHSTMNLKRVFGLVSSTENKEPKPMAWGNLLTAREVELEDIDFRMINVRGLQRDQERGEVLKEGVINWHKLNAKLESGHIENLKVADNFISGQDIHLELREKDAGLHCNQVDAQKARVGEGLVEIKDLLIDDGYSHVNMEHLNMEGTIQDFNDFVNTVNLDGQIREGSLVDMGHTISHFASVRSTFRGYVRGKVRGTVNNLHMENLFVQDPDNNIRVAVSGNIRDVEKEGNGIYDVKVKEISFDTKGLGGFVRAWAPNTKVDLGKFAPGERLTFQGDVDGPLADLHANGQFVSQIGSILVDAYIRDVISKDKDMRLGGKVATSNLHLGKVLGSEALGPISMRTSLDAVLKDKGRIDVQVDTVQIARFVAKGYEYKGISARGSYKNESLQANLVSRDPNLLLRFDGRLDLGNVPDALYRFTLDLQNADLNELHLDQRDIAGVRLKVESDIRRADAENLDGNVTVKGIVLESKDGLKRVGDILIDAHQEDNVHTVDISSTLLALKYKGSESVFQFVKDLKELMMDQELPALSGEEGEEWDGATYTLSAQVLDAQNLCSFLIPGLYIENKTSAEINITSQGLFNTQITSGRLAYYNRYIRDFHLDANNRSSTLTAAITGSTVDLGGRQLLGSKIDLVANDNRVNLDFVFDNQDEGKTYGQMHLEALLDRLENGLSVKGQVQPSVFCLNGREWQIGSENIEFNAGDIKVNQLRAKHLEQSLLVDGGLRPNHSDTLRIHMDQFDLDLLNTFIGGAPELDGLVTGRANVISPTKPAMGLLANVRCDSTYISGRPMGTLHITNVYEEEHKRFAATVHNELNGRTSINAQAYLVPSTKEVSASARLNQLDLAYAAPFLTSLFSEFGGALGGQLELSGHLGQKLHFSSKDLLLTDGLLKLDFTNVPYHAEGNLELKDDGLYFTPLHLTDGENGSGTVEGRLIFNDFKNLGTDIHVNFTDMHALNTQSSPEQSFFGNVYGTGRVDVTGDLTRMLLGIEATTRGGEIHVPLGSMSGDRSKQLLTFAESVEEKDPYEAMMATRTPSGKKKMDMNVELRVHATPDAQVYIDVDNESSLTAVGQGTVDLVSRSRQGLFTMNGDYTLSSGSFHFSAMNLVSRDFTIQDGSSVRFNGDVMDTDLNVNGEYHTKASLSNLTTDESGSSRRSVICGIQITGKLRNPQLSFSIDVPDLNPTIQAQVDAAFNTEDKVQKQFIYLLVAGNFLPSEESGITAGGSDVLFSNVSSIMSGQLNNIFQKLNIPLDLGLNYKATQMGTSLFDVALSTQLFNNRVVVNGSVGNRQNYGTSTNEVAGDIDIEIKLNRSGSLRLDLFSHSADQLSAFLDNSQRHGGGIAYQMEFNSFIQLFRELFSSRATKEARALEQARNPQKNVVLQIDTTGKAHVTKR